MKESEFVYIIHRRHRCHTCKGERHIEHPDWVAFWKLPNRRATESEAQTQHREGRWWAKRGYPYILPEQEIQCSTCNGTGYIDMEVHLEDALRELGIAVPKDE